MTTAGTYRRSAGTVDVIVIGAGHSGLAMSHMLTRKAIEHVVLDCGEIANNWRTERWDSLRLLTPNWMTRLPSFPYEGADPDGYMSACEVAIFIASYASHTSAPVLTHTRVVRVSQSGDGYRVATDRGDWLCRAVVLATAAFNTPNVPHFAQAMPGHIEQLSAQNYRNPARLADGGVLVVGGSASGLQLAQELRRSGRPVTLAVGSMCGCRAWIGGATFSGGCLRRACLTSASTKWTILIGPVTCLRRNL
ncbi:MAG: NAD(P)-binding domain-containing protein [Cypionkella sp.]